MAFKRYIHKHGKKLGPYYYENVRSNGRVKSIYLGTNPGHHPRHRIRKPLIFFILVLILILILGGSLFLLQNKAYLVGKVRQQDLGFDIDQILLKVLIRSSEYIEKQVRVMNTGGDTESITIEIAGLSDIVGIDSSSFSLKPGQTKVVNLNFSSIIPASNIEHQPGIYVGKLIVKSEKGSKEVPMVVEIETKNVLFDMNLNPVALERKVKQGQDTTIEVRLFNLENIESVNVDVEYFVKDINGNTIITESETVVAKTQASFFKTISIPKNLKPGPYIFAAKSKFGNSIGTASYLFEVAGPEQEDSFVQFCKNSILCLGLSLTTILLLFAMTAYFYFFIGAYLYERLTGDSVQRKKDEEGKTGIFGRLSGSISAWSQKRRKKKLENEQLKRRQELLELEAEQRQLESSPEETQRPGFFYRIGLAKTAEQREQEKLLKQKEMQQRLKEEQDLKRQRELEAKKKQYEESLKQQQEERQRRLQLEAEAKKDQLRKQLELTAERRKEEARKREELEIERKKQEEITRQEELKKQKELERQKAVEDEKRLHEEKKLEAEREKKQREIDKQKQQQLKEQKLEAIKQLEEKLRKNKETGEQLKNGLKKAEHEKRGLTSSDNDIEARIKKLDHEILEKSRQSEELSLEKNSIFEKYQKQLNELTGKRESQKADRESKIMGMRSKLAEQQSALMRELEDELSKLAPEKRKSTEKWKRLEIKAKMKLAEENLEEEIKNYSSGKEDTKSIDDGYNKSMAELGDKQKLLKQEISQLESQKQKVLLEKKNVPRGIEAKESEIQSLLAGLEKNAQERELLTAELSRLKSEISIFNIGFLKGLVSGYKEKAEKAKKEKEIETARLESEKRRNELASKKERELEEKSRKIEEQRKKKEQDKAAKEEQRKKEIEEKLKALEEKKRQKSAKKEAETSIAKATAETVEPAAEKKGFFSRFFGSREEAKREEETTPTIKPKSEAEELEKAIKSLDLFKKIEEGKSISEKEPLFKKFLKKGPKNKEPGRNILGNLFARKQKEPEISNFEKRKKAEKEAKQKEETKRHGSKQLEKCGRLLDDVKDAISKHDPKKAKKMYIEARELYVKLDYKEKKEVYSELMELYKELSK